MKLAGLGHRPSLKKLLSKKPYSVLRLRLRLLRRAASDWRRSAFRFFKSFWNAAFSETARSQARCASTLRRALVLFGEWSYKALNLWAFRDGFLWTFVLTFNFLVVGGCALNNVFTHIIGRTQVKKFADLGRTLGAKAQRVVDIVTGQTWNGSVTNLDNDKVKDCKVRAYNATTNGLALALS